MSQSAEIGRSLEVAIFAKVDLILAETFCNLHSSDFRSELWQEQELHRQHPYSLYHCHKTIATVFIHDTYPFTYAQEIICDLIFKLVANINPRYAILSVSPAGDEITSQMFPACKTNLVWNKYLLYHPYGLGENQ